MLLITLREAFVIIMDEANILALKIIFTEIQTQTVQYPSTGNTIKTVFNMT